MNTISGAIGDLKNVLDETKGIIILIKENPGIDDIATGLAFYLSLSSQGKQVQIICATPMRVEFSRLIGVDKIENRINDTTGNNLVISFPYEEGSIEKVSYNIENGAFNLVIEPREDYGRITPENVHYAYSGGKMSTIMVIGCHSLDELGEIYSKNKSLIDGAQIISISTDDNNTGFGKINMIDTSASSLAELTTRIYSLINFSLDADIATNLLLGISSKTKNFTSNKTTAMTFEAAAICLKNGAKKIYIDNSHPVTGNENTAIPSFSSTATQKTSVTNTREAKQQISFKPQHITFQGSSPTSQQKQKSQQPKISGGTGDSRQTQQQHQQHPSQQPQGQKQNQQSKQETPADWLKPKIYKGSTLL